MVFRTNKNAPNFRLIVIDIENPAEENWGTLIEVKYFRIKLDFSDFEFMNWNRKNRNSSSLNIFTAI